MDLSKSNPNREFLLYKTGNGNIKVDVLFQNETIRMPQNTAASWMKKWFVPFWN